jgi:HD-GYP domain-containing protein (c-di-GMP phosphodiesterase class II)
VPACCLKKIVKENKKMFQRPDYTILDHLTEICEVVDFNLCYLYVNDAAAEREHISKDKLIGHTVPEVHPDIESTQLFLHLKECLEKRRSVEFEDKSSHPDSTITRWEIRIDPIAEGAFIHSTGLSADKTKVKIKKQMVRAGITNRHLRRPIDPWPAYNSLSKDQSKDLQIEGWLDALDSRTRETTEHIFRVADATVTLAKMTGVHESEIVQIRRGALLHDIGKIGIPDTILLKSDKLTSEEWEIVRKHPIYAYELFYPIEYLRNCLSIPYSHHEKWDGTGYPLGLKGEQIPLPARLFAIVDVWDTLSCDRVYAKAWPQEKITNYIKQQSSRHFDPEVVELFFHAQEQLTDLVRDTASVD